MAQVVQEQPEDATYEEIMRELAFERMVARGLEDSRADRVISNDEMRRRIRTWKDPGSLGAQLPAEGILS
jgi:hypothetical protein